jgi:hypothetical protein
MAPSAAIDHALCRPALIFQTAYWHTVVVFHHDELHVTHVSSAEAARRSHSGFLKIASEFFQCLPISRLTVPFSLRSALLEKTEKKTRALAIRIEGEVDAT